MTLTEVLAAHRPQMGQTLARGSLVCTCRCETLGDTDEWVRHVTEAVSAAGLTVT